MFCQIVCYFSKVIKVLKWYESQVFFWVYNKIDMENVYLNFDVYSPVKGIPGQYHTSDTLVEVPPALEQSLVIQGKCERLADILIEIESTKHQSSNKLEVSAS